jgi:hypothetical protein
LKEDERPITGDEGTVERDDTGREDWRLPIIRHLQSLGDTKDKRVWR